MADPKLKDPADKGRQEKDQAKAQEDMKSFDVSSLSIEDFKPLGERVAKAPHPFDGYPQKLIPFGEKQGKPVMLPAHTIIALKPQEYVHQDPSGKGVSIMHKGKEKIVNIPTFHNRVAPDYENGGQNTKVIFDRTVPLKDGLEMPNCAYIPSHSVRAQLCFKLNQKGDRIMVDNRYILLDPNQGSRLRRVFEMIVNPRIANERLSQAISGESNETIEDIAD